MQKIRASFPQEVLVGFERSRIIFCLTKPAKDVDLDDISPEMGNSSSYQLLNEVQPCDMNGHVIHTPTSRFFLGEFPTGSIADRYVRLFNAAHAKKKFAGIEWAKTLYSARYDNRRSVNSDHRKRPSTISSYNEPKKTRFDTAPASNRSRVEIVQSHNASNALTLDIFQECMSGLAKSISESIAALHTQKNIENLSISEENGNNGGGG